MASQRPRRDRKPPPRFANAVPLVSSYDDDERDRRIADEDSLGENSLSDFEPDEEEGEDDGLPQQDDRLDLFTGMPLDLDAEDGEEFGESEDEQAVQPLDAEMLQAAQQWYTVKSTSNTNAEKLPALGSSEQRSLAHWKKIAQQRRGQRPAHVDETQDVEVEDDAIRGLADAFGGTEIRANVEDVGRWNRALHAEEQPEEELDDEGFEQDLRGASGFRMKRRPGNGKIRRAPREQALSAEVRLLLREANSAFIMADLDVALAKLQEVIRHDNAIRSAWATMALCYNETGQHDKQLQCRIIEAHLTPHPLTLWVELAERSQAYGYVEQTLYCLSKAVAASEEKDRSDVLDIMWQRAQILLTTGARRRAVGAYMQILRYRPQNQDIIHAVIPVMVELGMLDKGVDVLRRCAEWNMKTFPDPIDCDETENADGEMVQSYTYKSSEMVTLADLLLDTDRPAEAIDVLRQGQRWLQGRAEETFWEAVEDDREFDVSEDARAEREGDFGRQVNFAPIHELDPEFRFRLGIARGKMGDISEAMLHFDVWRDGVEVSEHMDKHGTMVDEMLLMGDYLKDDRPNEAKEMYQTALDIAETVVAERHREQEEADEQELSAEQFGSLREDYKRVARCCMPLQDYHQAVRYLREIVTEFPDDLESKLRLAEAYGELNETRKAVDLISEVMQAKREMQRAEAVGVEHAELADGDSDDIAQSLSLFAEMSSQRTKANATAGRAAARGAKEHMVRLEAVNEAEAKKVQMRLKEQTAGIFVERWWHVDHPMAGDPYMRIYGNQETPEQRKERFSAVSRWLDDMEYLVNMFTNTPQLYPRDRSKRFAGLFRHHRKRGDLIDRKARELLNRIGNAMIDESLFTNEVEQTTFRGIGLDEWVDLIMQYAAVLTKVGDYAVAKAILRRAITSIVVWKDAQRCQSLNLCLAACALYVGRWKDVMDESALRTLPHRYQFHNEALRVFGVVANSGGNAGRRALSSANNLKFFLRRSRIHEALVQGSTCVYSYSRNRWVIRDKLFEHSNANGKGSDEEQIGEDEDGDGAVQAATDDEDEEGEDEEEDEDEEDDEDGEEENSQRITPRRRRESGRANPQSSSSGLQTSRRKLLINSKQGDAQTVWDEVKAMVQQNRIGAVNDCKDAPPTQYDPANDIFYAGLLLTSCNGIPSMGYCLRVYARFKNDPLVCLACAIACLGRATNRQVDNRHQVVVEAYAFLNLYRSIRRRDRAFTQHVRTVKSEGEEDGAGEGGGASDEAEVHYNLGRAAHQLGLMQMASTRYLAVLRAAQARRDKMRRQMDLDEEHAPVVVAPIHLPLFDCVAESAYALHLIYVSSGNPTLANAILERHLRV